jgi:hypothetical protein
MHRSWERKGRVSWSLVGRLTGWLIDYHDQYSILLSDSDDEWPRPRDVAAGSPVTRSNSCCACSHCSASGPCGGVRVLSPAAACVLVVAGNMPGSLVGRPVEVVVVVDRHRSLQSCFHTCTHTAIHTYVRQRAQQGRVHAQRIAHYKLMSSR